MKKALSLVLALMLAVTLIVPLSAIEADAAFSARTTMPEFDSAEGQKYYIPTIISSVNTITARTDSITAAAADIS